MRINPLLYGLFVLGIFLGTIFGFQSLGIWSTSGKVTGEGELVTPDPKDASTIKGWMTLEQITAAYPVSLDEIVQQFGLPAETPASAALKDLESETFDVTRLREWLQTRIEGQPAPAGTQPAPGAPQDSQPPATPTPHPAAAQPAPAATEHVAAVGTITGKTTFQELLDWGVPQAAIEAQLGASLPASATLIRDYAVAQGLEFSALKTALQAEVDKIK